MSPPDTNIEKQEKRHKPALSGIALSLIVAALLIVAVSFYLFSTDADQAADSATPTDEVTAPATEESAPAAEETAPATTEGN